MLHTHLIHIKRSRLGFILLLLGTNMLLGQSALQEFKKIVDNYRREGVNLEYRLRYAYFAGKAKLPSDTVSIAFTQNGNNYRMKAKDFEWLKEGNRLLWVDHENQQMVLQNAKANAGSFTLDQLEQMIVQEGFQISGHWQNKGLKLLRLSNPDAPGQSIEMAYDPKTYFIFQTVIQNEDPESAANNSRLVISYQDYQLKKGGFTWSMKQYFIEAGKQRQVSKRYRAYALQVI